MVHLFHWLGVFHVKDVKYCRRRNDGFFHCGRVRSGEKAGTNGVSRQRRRSRGLSCNQGAGFDCAADALTNADDRMNAAANLAPETVTTARPDRSKQLSSIREPIKADPTNCRQTKQFIKYFLPMIVANGESHVVLTELAQRGDGALLADLWATIDNLVPRCKRLIRPPSTMTL